jgi:hypothetical protein
MTENPTAPPTPGQPKIDTDLSDKKANNDPLQGLPASTQLDNQSEPFRPDAEKKSDPSGKYIKYTGPNTVRIMDAEAWQSAHVDSEDYVEWNYLNNKQVPMSAFTDEQLQYLLRVDDRFAVIELDKDGKLVENSSETSK